MTDTANDKLDAEVKQQDAAKAKGDEDKPAELVAPEGKDLKMSQVQQDSAKAIGDKPAELVAPDEGKDLKMPRGQQDSAKAKGDKDKPAELVAPDEGGKDLKMSRGLKPDLDVDFEKLRTLFVFDELGNKIRFSDIFKMQKTIVIFIRHFLDFITKEYVEDLAIIPLEYLQTADIRLVVIGPAPFKFIKPFKQLTNYQYTLYCDPDREVYKTMGLYEKQAAGLLTNSKHVKSGVVMGVLKSMWRAMQAQEYQGSPKQQGGSFIMGPGEEIHFYHQDETCTDHMSINDLLIEAGVQPVSFPKDQRVITI